MFETQRIIKLKYITILTNIARSPLSVARSVVAFNEVEIYGFTRASIRFMDLIRRYILPSACHKYVINNAYMHLNRLLIPI